MMLEPNIQPHWVEEAQTVGGIVILSSVKLG